MQHSVMLTKGKGIVDMLTQKFGFEVTLQETAVSNML